MRDEVALQIVIVVWVTLAVVGVAGILAALF